VLSAELALPSSGAGSDAPANLLDQRFDRCEDVRDHIASIFVPSSRPNKEHGAVATAPPSSVAAITRTAALIGWEGQARQRCHGQRLCGDPAAEFTVAKDDDRAQLDDPK
jgi:hypothetical protein